MKYIGNVQAEANSEVFAVASGALPDGKPVIVNSDGTVSVVEVAVTAKGTEVEFNTYDTSTIGQAFDSNSNKVVIFYGNDQDSDNLTAIVGTVNPSDNSISFGSPVVVSSGSRPRSASLSCIFDSNSNKVVISWSDQNNSFYGTAIVGTVSSTSISFGTAVVFESANTVAPNITFDSNSNKAVICYRDAGNSSYGTCIVGTVSSTSISFGSAATFNSSNTRVPKATFDSNSNKVVVTFFDYGDGNKGKAVVGTVSSTSISFGSVATYAGVNLNGYASGITFDSNSNKVVIAYGDDADSAHGKAIIGTVSGTSISFGTAVTFEAASTIVENAIFDPTTNKVCIAYVDNGNSSYGTLAVGSVSGTSISFETPFVFHEGTSNRCPLVKDSNANRVVIPFNGVDNDGFAIVIAVGAGTTLTTENFIGFSTGFASPADAGSATTFETGKTDTTDIAYIGSNKVVIAYRQHYNTSGSQTNDGYCVVGTISGTGISFGTATSFNTNAAYIHVANAENDKVVVFYQDGDNSNYATARVGTVSGTSISFGTAVVANSGSSAYTNVEGIGSDKIVGVYRDDGDSDKGKAIVGTVSGTGISFGSEVEFNTTGDGYDLASIGSSKVVIAYKDVGNSGHGTAIVGTVSGTSISFGSEAVYEAATTGSIDTGIAYIGSDKVVISYQDEGNSDNGTAIVGTVSGTSISFGTAAVFEADETSITNSTSIGGDKVVIVYSQGSVAGQGNGKYAVGTVSGTGISFDTAVTFNAAPSWDMAVVSPEDNKVAISWGQHYDTSGSRLGQALVTTIEDRGSLADGKVATIQAGGAISTIQGGLTAGQQYFVQGDGTLGLSADDPSVIAGTAVSATNIIVKG